MPPVRTVEDLWSIKASTKTDYLAEIQPVAGTVMVTQNSTEVCTWNGEKFFFLVVVPLPCNGVVTIAEGSYT